MLTFYVSAPFPLYLLTFQGGIACEPFLIFTECNEHQNVAFNLFSKAIEENANYEAASQKFANYLINECPRKDYHVFEGWIEGLYEADAVTYPIDDQGDGMYTFCFVCIHKAKLRVVHCDQANGVSST